MIQINDAQFNLTQLEKLLFQNEKIVLSNELLERANKNFEFLKSFSRDKVIYGINTGFGPMAQYKIPYTDRLTLQYNLIRSHAGGAGKPIDSLYSKAMLLDRLNTFCQCKSGVHPDLLLTLQAMFNAEIYPVIYEHGGVGASGDLVQLAHLALAVIGEGEVFYKDEICEAKFAFEKEKITPFAIRLREGLGLMNGTSCMTGIGLVNLLKSKQLLHWSVLISAMLNEIFGAFDDHISAALNNVKRHVGQQKIASLLREITADSKLMRSRQKDFYGKEQTVEKFKEKVQEYYSLRCMPQILGPILDTILQAEKIVVDEFNSVSDNPVVDDEIQNIFHGGNFHGDYVSLEMDKLKMAITKLSMLSERQLNYLLNDKLNEKLPPFLNRGTLGLNFGVQGFQYTATSTVAENQTLSNPMYVHSIPSNNDNQDIVSMGTNAALLCARVIENTFEVLAVQVMALMQATDCLEAHEKLSPKLKVFYQEIRAITKIIEKDNPPFKDIAKVKAYLMAGKFEL